ncbi:MAG: hypothetical protein WCT40_03665 [Candidatus Magasanikbacteria bacterium]|jgi:membrane-bound lytic murein transglycosylase B
MITSFFSVSKISAIVGLASFFLFFSIITPSMVRAQSTSATQAQLEQELKDIEQQIAQYTAELGKTKTEKTTLASKIKQLQAQQKKISLQIKETGVKLNALSGQLTTTAGKIKTTQTKEKQLLEAVSAVLVRMNSVDESMLLALATSAGLSSAYNEVRDYASLTKALKGFLEKNKIVRADLIKLQGQLEDQKSDTANLLKIKSIQQSGLVSSLGEQNQLLTETKGKESEYQAILADKKKRASEIRNRIYELFNTGSQINFGQAVDIAKWVAQATGIRAAFVLAVLTQESNLGKNVGTCNRSGDPSEKSWKVIMKPTRDQEPFKTITSELGLDIDTTPVSCPMRDKNGGQIGWGGAMGPAQFIPSTWMGYRAKVTKITGKSAANPWDIRDAFLASAIKLRADGADGTDDGDWKAAMKYFAGSVNLKYRFYGDNVLATTKKYLQDIGDL